MRGARYVDASAATLERPRLRRARRDAIPRERADRRPGRRRGPRLATYQPRALRAGRRRWLEPRAAHRRGSGGPAGVRRRHRLGRLCAGSAVSGSTGSARVVERSARAVSPYGDSAIISQAGIRRVGGGIAPRDLTVVDGVPLTTAVHAVVFRHAARRRRSRGRPGTSPWRRTPTWSRSTRRPPTRGCGRAPASAGLASPGVGAASLLADGELLVAAGGRDAPDLEARCGLPRPLCNHPIFDLLGTTSGPPICLIRRLEWWGSTTARCTSTEPSGAATGRARKPSGGVGLECFTMLAGDSADPRPDGATGCMRPALVHGGPRRRTGDWTLELPPWWIPTFTVEQRPQPDDGQRARLLKLRLRTA